MTAVTWHSSKPAFRPLSNQPEDEAAYMSTNQAHEQLVSFIGVEECVADKTGDKRKSYRLELQEDTGLTKVLGNLAKQSNKAFQLLATNKEETFWKTFSLSNFKPVSVVNFTKG